MERILVGSKDFLANHRVGNPDDLANTPFIGLMPHVMDRVTLVSTMGAERRTVPIHTHVSTDGLLASYHAMRLGLGVAASARWLCGSDLSEGTIKRVLPKWRLDPISVEAVSIAGRYKPARINAFVDILCEVMSSLDGFEPS